MAGQTKYTKIPGQSKNLADELQALDLQLRTIAKRLGNAVCQHPQMAQLRATRGESKGKRKKSN